MEVTLQIVMKGGQTVYQEFNSILHLPDILQSISVEPITAVSSIEC
jgi:hypothetical protein